VERHLIEWDFESVAGRNGRPADGPVDGGRRAAPAPFRRNLPFRDESVPPAPAGRRLPPAAGPSGPGGAAR